MTRLEEFLKANPGSTGLQKEIREGNIEYIPTKVTNATVIFSNPSSETILVEYESVRTAIVAPGTKVRNIALWITPLGTILAVPWLVNMWKQRKQS